MKKSRNKNHNLKKSKPLNKNQLRNKIVGVFTDNPSLNLNYKQIAKRIDISDESTRRLITTVLYELKGAGYLIEMQTGKFKYHHKEAYITGVVDVTSTGSAYIISDDVLEDVFVSRESLATALHGDTVKVHVRSKKRRNKAEGEVVEILKRARETFVGNIEKTNTYGFLIPDSKKMQYDIFIPATDLRNVENGAKAIVRIIEWSKGAKNPVGEIVKILGMAGENEAEIHAILEEFQLPYEFDEKLENAADKIQLEITKEEISKRKDFREITTFTIDPDDAKDFDDALSVRKLDNGNWEVGVHIADVSHYVIPDSPIDNEAFERATSVYLVDRVVPMLPEKLSNYICSLRPDEEKLCFSAVFEMDEDANILKEWFGKTVINSDKRFTYADAQLIIDTQEGDLKEEVLTLHDLAQKMRQNRYNSGAISFDRAEVKFNLDENGKALGVFFKEHGTSNELIEEFMLLANKKVAEKIGEKKQGGTPKTFVYRIHDKPDMERLSAFATFIARFGYSINSKSGTGSSQAINKLLKQVKGTNEQNLIENLAVRSMAKAIYSTKNIGHYGLAFTYYSHFTSPIRRYPDLMVHRLLFQYLNGQSSVDAELLEKDCNHCSDMESKSAMAERASIKYKQVEYMKDKIGQEFDGIISGVTDWGIFVEIIENKVEGMISLRDLDDDFYVFDEDDYCISGQRNGKTYRLGDKVKIEIKNANLLKKQLDFKLANIITPAGNSDFDFEY